MKLAPNPSVSPELVESAAEVAVVGKRLRLRERASKGAGQITRIPGRRPQLLNIESTGIPQTASSHSGM